MNGSNHSGSNLTKSLLRSCCHFYDLPGDTAGDTIFHFTVVGSGGKRSGPPSSNCKEKRAQNLERAPMVALCIVLAWHSHQIPLTESAKFEFSFSDKRAKIALHSLKNHIGEVEKNKSESKEPGKNNSLFCWQQSGDTLLLQLGVQAHLGADTTSPRACSCLL